MCTLVTQGVEYCCTGSIDRPLLPSDALYCVAAARGFLRCSVSLSPLVLSLADSILKPLYISVHSISSHCDRSGNTISGSLLLSEWLGLLSDFAEATPLSSLPVRTLTAVMSVAQPTLLDSVFHHLKRLAPSYSALAAEAKRLGRPMAAASVADREELSSLFVEILTAALSFLDHIASSDVAVCVRGARTAHEGFAEGATGAAMIEVDTLLCTSLLMLSSQIVSVDIMNSFKIISDKYLSILNLVLRSHASVLGCTWLALGAGIKSPEDVPPKVALLTQMLAQILCAIESCDSTTGKMALLALKSFGVFYRKISSSSFVPTENPHLSSAAVREAVNTFLVESFSFLLGMMLPSSAASARSGMSAQLQK